MWPPRLPPAATAWAGPGWAPWKPEGLADGPSGRAGLSGMGWCEVHTGACWVSHAVLQLKTPLGAPRVEGSRVRGRLRGGASLQGHQWPARWGGPVIAGQSELWAQMTLQLMSIPEGRKTKAEK